LGIKGEKSFMRVWGAAMDYFAKQNQDARRLTKSIPVVMPYELVTKADAFRPEHEKFIWG